MGVSAYNVNRDVEYCFQVFFQSEDKGVFRWHIHKNIHIAVGAVVATCDRPEYGKSRNSVFPSYVRKVVAQDCKTVVGISHGLR